jgi:hypothetical protein
MKLTADLPFAELWARSGGPKITAEKESRTVRPWRPQ